MRIEVAAVLNMAKPAVRNQITPTRFRVVGAPKATAVPVANRGAQPHDANQSLLSPEARPLQPANQFHGR